MGCLCCSCLLPLPACSCLLPLQVMKVMPVQRMTKAGQRTRMKVGPTVCCQ
jgi:ribosomal protein S5